METTPTSLPNVLWHMDGQGSGSLLDWKPGAPLPAGDGLPWLHLNYADRDVREWLLGSGLLTPPVAESLLDEETRPRVLHHGNGLLLTLRGVNLNPGAEPEDMVSIRLWIEEGRIISTLLGHHNCGTHAQLLFGLPQTSHQAVAPVVVARGCFKQQGNAQRTLGLAFIRVGGGATGYG